MSTARNADKFVVGPIWDIDLGFDNDYRTYPVNHLNGFIYATNGSVAGSMRDFANRILMSDPQARHRMSEIWSELRVNGNFNAGHFNALVDQYAGELAQSQALNFVRWPILSSTVHMNPRALGSFANEVTAMKNYITNRVTRLDQLIGIVQVGIDQTETDNTPATAPTEFYRLDGVRLDSHPATPGIYICRQGTKTSKIVVR